MPQVEAHLASEVRQSAGACSIATLHAVIDAVPHHNLDHLNMVSQILKGYRYVHPPEAPHVVWERTRARGAASNHQRPS
eukprot:9486185-Pyramimonas_sp.AAC.1